MSCSSQTDEVQLFNGTSLDGWEGSDTAFRVEQAAIVGGSLEEALPETRYLCSLEEFDNYNLTLSAKFETEDLGVNGGISFRAQRVPDYYEVMGYQADVGFLPSNVVPTFSDAMPADTTGLYPIWGSLVDENRVDTSRYPNPDIFPVIILNVADQAQVEGLIEPRDWNEVSVTANGPAIEIQINGVTTTEFMEDTDVDTSGKICLQAHAGGPYEVWYKDIVLTPLGE
ncbi:MAG: DUF1080 domain-containing protein [Bacteroidota bacterium]